MRILFGFRKYLGASGNNVGTASGFRHRCFNRVGTFVLLTLESCEYSVKSASSKCFEHNYEYFVGVKSFLGLFLSQVFNSSGLFNGYEWNDNPDEFLYALRLLLLHPNAEHVVGIVSVRRRLIKK